MKVYLASRYSRIKEMNRVRESLANIGIEVTSRWINGGHQSADNELNDFKATFFASEDIQDIINADLLIHFSEEPRTPTRGGRHFEAGFAYGQGKPVIIVGPLENVFMCLADVERYETFEALLARLICEHAMETGVAIEQK